VWLWWLVAVVVCGGCGDDQHNRATHSNPLSLQCGTTALGPCPITTSDGAVLVRRVSHVCHVPLNCLWYLNVAQELVWS